MTTKERTTSQSCTCYIIPSQILKSKQVARHLRLCYRFAGVFPEWSLASGTGLDDRLSVNAFMILEGSHCIISGHRDVYAGFSARDRKRHLVSHVVGG